MVDADEWMRVARTKQNDPKLVPAIGVKIEVRLVVRYPNDWATIEEVIDGARAHGAADIVKYEVLDG